ncbi:MAG: hypothetical protein RMM98_05345 [Acidobacteriota bacterium]|nr:hypothetical protein [Blastocatellia bacterium]MDW8239020.1 hypothetical protein [Acidobacteriota bacterium]
MDRWNVLGVETPSYIQVAALRRVFAPASDTEELPINTPSPRTSQAAASDFLMAPGIPHPTLISAEPRKWLVTTLSDV